MTAQRDRGSGREADRRGSLPSELEREGAVAIGLRPLDRQLAHDLRGPLNSMMLHVALLGRAARGELTALDDLQAKQQEWLRAIEHDLARMAADLDRWSSLVAGSGAAPERLDLRAVVREARDALAPLAERRRLELELALPPGEVAVRGVRRKLVRLLASSTCAVARALADGACLRLELASDGTQATLEAAGEDPGDAADELAEAAPAADVLAGLAAAFEAEGARFEALGAFGWRARWPICDGGAGGRRRETTGEGG